MVSIQTTIFKDSFLVFASFIFAFGTVSKFEGDSRVSVPLGVFLTFLGTIFFVSFTNLLNKLMLSTETGLKFIKHFNLSLSDCIDIANK